MKSGAKEKFNHESSRIFMPFCAIRGLFFNLFQKERLYQAQNCAGLFRAAVYSQST
jgi:hypothetical protein